MIFLRRDVGQGDKITEWKKDVIWFTQSLYECLKWKYKRADMSPTRFPRELSKN